MTAEDFEREINNNPQLFEFMKFMVDNKEYTNIALERLNECKRTVA